MSTALVSKQKWVNDNKSPASDSLESVCICVFFDLVSLMFLMQRTLHFVAISIL